MLNVTQRELRVKPITKERNCRIEGLVCLNTKTTKTTYCAGDENYMDNIVCLLLPSEVLDCVVVSYPNDQQGTPTILPSTSSCRVMALCRDAHLAFNVVAFS